MTEHDILTDAEREALSEVMQAPVLVQSHERVLVVDDDRESRFLLAELLTLHGIECLTAQGEPEAWALLQADMSIGLLLTDLRMHPHSGLELIGKVRKSHLADLPVIIISGHADARDAIEAMHLHVVDFLLKPIDTQKLLQLIRQELQLEPPDALQVQA
ncbi:response regulator [Pseudomonas sp.]|uniref:response regulator n=1 Tax=Pseudomonas sp. TaxID=306 RepID=UPI0026151A4B|nr:response regulator [Pseudomonas sp.]